MPTGEFFVRLQHGITGGFVAPTVHAVHTITQSEDSNNFLTVDSAVRPDGAPDLPNFTTKKVGSKENNIASLLEELYCILSSIPMESPPGSEDIYGMDTSISWGSEGLQWTNAAPDGCVQGISEVKPTEEEKAKFKRAVQIVKELAEKDAHVSS